MILGHIYYLIGILVCILILSLLSKHKKSLDIRKWYVKFKQVTGEKPTKEQFRSKEEFKIFEESNSIMLIELIWIIGGLITSSWYIFLCILFLSFIQTKLLKPFRFTFLYNIASLSFLFSKFFVYLFMIINHFHLHQDIYLLIKNL